MKSLCAAIICEYNPFHTGHLYQIHTVRERFGGECVILCIMSGHFVQRGDTAVFDKFTRAETAVRGGADLVLELPFPYAAASAEYFADAGVWLAYHAGADVLVFGSESGDLHSLQEAARLLHSPTFTQTVAAHRETGVVATMERTYADADMATRLLQSNDILAVAYLNAIQRICPDQLTPHVIQRAGAGYRDKGSAGGFMSASGIRACLDESSALSPQILQYLPPSAYPLYERELAAGRAPASMDNLGQTLLAFFRLTDPDTLTVCAEMTGGLQYRMQAAALTAPTYPSFFASLRTKKYTDARLRRTILFALAGVTRAMLKEPPQYTQLLAVSERGREQLRRLRKSETLSIVTKPSDDEKLRAAARRQYTLSVRMDGLYTLAQPRPQAANVYLKKSPYIAKTD